LRTLLFANGTLTNPQSALSHAEGADRIIAANGGALHCLNMNVIPDLLIGDLDSLDSETLAALRTAGTVIEQHPARKDETDLEIALRHALDEGASHVTILGAMGARWDQSIANLLLLAHEDLSADIRLVDDRHELTLLRGGETRTLSGAPGDIVSLLPLAGDAVGIRSTGLEYSLHVDTLRFGSTRGVSNVLEAPEATVSLQKGLLVCVMIHK
jgi:thiamine pyrophosphokinase